MVGKELFQVPDDVRPQLVARGAPRRDRRGAATSSSSRSPAAPSWSRSRAASCCRSSTQQWKDHLYSLDHLKEGIGLRGYGQRDPLVEYKKESFTLFQAMKERIDEEMVRYLWRLRPVISDRRRRRPGRRRRAPSARRRRGRRSSRSATPSSRRRRRPRPSARSARRRGAERAAPGARRRRRRAVKHGPARRAQGRPQRSLPVRQRQEVQEVPRRQPVMPVPVTPRVHSKADAVCRPFVYALATSRDPCHVHTC